MFILVPYGVDNPMSRLPLVNWAIILLDVIVFAIQATVGVSYRIYALVPGDFHLYQLLTSMFLHVGPLHLFGNMLFLWTFGNNVNDRLGHLGYGVAYVLLGMVAGLGHMAVAWGSSRPCVGASGAIFGVVGLYVVFSPLNDVRVWYMFIVRLGTFSCSGFWIIGFYVAMNVLDVILGTAGRVAVMAHLAGFGAGFGVALFLLKRGLVERDDYDLLSWISGKREKEMLARFSRNPSGDVPLPPPPGLGAARGGGRMPSARELQAELRAHLVAGDTRRLLDAYQRFHNVYPRLALGEELQIDVANALFRAGQHAQAAEAFERFARYYPAHPQAADALYSAGMLRARRTGEPDHGRRLLEEAIPLLKDKGKITRAMLTCNRIGDAAAARRVKLDT